MKFRNFLVKIRLILDVLFQQYLISFVIFLYQWHLLINGEDAKSILFGHCPNFQQVFIV